MIVNIKRFSGYIHIAKQLVKLIKIYYLHSELESYSTCI